MEDVRSSEGFEDSGNWFIDPEQGLPFEDSVAIAFKRNPALHERVKVIAKQLDMNVNDCVRQMMNNHEHNLEANDAERERYNAKVDWQISPYGNDPLLTQKGR
jgi:hypothetical protein